MLDLHTKNKIINAVQGISDFADFGIAFEGGDACEVLKEPSMPKGLSSWVYIAEDHTIGIPVSTPASYKQNQIAQKQVMKTTPKQSKLGTEWLNMGISCGSAVLTGAVSVAGVLAAPVTGGASIAITTLAWTAAAASALQCGVGIGRVINEHDDTSLNETLNDSTVYNGVMYAADGVQLANDVVGIGGVIKVSGKLIKVGQGGQQTLTKMVEGFNRAERKLLARELSGAASNGEFKRLVRSGDLSKILTLKQIRWTAANELMNVLGASLDLWGSARGGNIQYIITLASETQNNN